jgi:orotidine-5'-phosphate decarboxylase
MSKAIQETDARSRLIVALDVPSADEALRLVDELEGTVVFYKVGLELLMAGGMESLLRRLVDGKRVFVDLKLPSDIPETVRRVVEVAASLRVSFITLSNSATSVTIRAAAAGRAGRENPRLLFVPWLSSLDRADFAQIHQADASTFEDHLKARTAQAQSDGADGFIVSGQEIGLLRSWYPDTILVSPGIRPAGSTTDDHKRSCTPGEAITLGADYIVVGRPIRNAKDRRGTAQSIIDEIDKAMSAPGGRGHTPGTRQGTNGSSNGGYSASSYSVPAIMSAKSG